MSTRGENLSHGVLLIGLGILAITQNWWPSLLIVLGVFFSFRNFLNGSYLRMLSTLVFYGAVYACLQYPFFITWEFLLPLILFTLGFERILGEFFLFKKKRTYQSKTQG